MRILFLDDNKERHKAFKGRAIGCVVDYAWSAAEAIAFLKSDNVYDLLMLDHDLGGPEQEGQLLEGVEDGRTVAAFIAKNHPKHMAATIVVHSLNKDGAVIMISKLSAVGYTAHYLPFGWRRFEKTENGCIFQPNIHRAPPEEIDILTDE